MCYMTIQEKVDFEDLQNLTLAWADDKDLLHEENADKQFMKFVEEVFEFKDSFTTVKLASQLWEQLISQGININFENEFFKDMKLEMGDIFVTLIILCEQLGLDPVECLSMAYEKISKRTGKTINGTFVKESDL